MVTQKENSVRLNDIYKKETGELATCELELYDGTVEDIETTEYIKWLESKILGDNFIVFKMSYDFGNDGLIQHTHRIHLAEAQEYISKRGSDYKIFMEVK